MSVCLDVQNVAVCAEEQSVVECVESGTGAVLTVSDNPLCKVPKQPMFAPAVALVLKRNEAKLQLIKSGENYIPASYIGVRR